MNEQNNNINPTQQPYNNGQQPIQPTQPGQSIQPVSQNIAQPVNPINQPQQAPVAQGIVPNQPVQQPSIQPMQQSAPMQQVAPTPSVNPQPMQQVNQPIQNNTPQVTPNINEQPVQNNIQPENVVPQNQTINQPITNMNNQQNIAPQQTPVNQGVNGQFNPSVPNNGVFAPSVPIGGASDATNIGFVAASSEIPKKKKPALVIGIIFVILIVLGVIGYFVIYPYIMKTYFSDPKNVYETSIKSAFKGINSTVTDIVHSKGIYNLEVSADSNIESLAEYVGYTYGINLGIDPTKKTLQEGLYVKNNKTNAEHSYYTYLKDNKYYNKYSSYRDYIYLGEATPNDPLLSIFDEEDLFRTSNNLNDEEINYIVNKFADLLVDSINEDKLTQEDASISINGETLKVTNNKYEIDYTTLKETIEFIRDGLVKDDKAIEILAKISNVDASEIKETLNTIKIEDKTDENDFSITTNIYTYGNKNEIIGFAITDKDEHVNFYYYFKGDIIDSKLTISYKDDYNNNETIVVKLSGTKNNNTTNIKVAYDNKDINDSNKGNELLTLDIKSWDEKGIDLDYSINISDEKFNGALKFVNDVNNDRAKYSLDFSIKNGNEYVEISINFSDDWTSEVANINNSTAVTLTDEEIANVQMDFFNNIKETPIIKAITTVSNDYDPSIQDYYNNDYYNDYYNYSETDETDNNLSDF